MKKYIKFLFVITFLLSSCQTNEPSTPTNNDVLLYSETIKTLNLADKLSSTIATDIVFLWSEGIERDYCLSCSLSTWSGITSVTDQQIIDSFSAANPYLIKTPAGSIRGRTRDTADFIFLVLFTHQYLGNFSNLDNYLSDSLTKIQNISSKSDVKFVTLQNYYLKIKELTTIINDFSGYSYLTYSQKVKTLISEISTLNSTLEIYK
jgi:hypothetical protein